MTHFVCVTCGTQFADSGEAPPASCPICEDPRQYVPPGGQAWTTLEALRARGHANTWRQVAPDLLAIHSVPQVGIGQRALLLRTPQGNVLWDCITLLDEATVTLVRGLGGLAAIAISHPHYYSAMVEWSRAFGCPVWLHAADRRHVMRPDAAALRFWEGETHALLPGVTLHRLGGHFAGGTVLHWENGRGGALLSGDIAQVAPDRYVSFLWSYPNMIPLPAAEVARMGAVLAGLEFETVHGAFPGRDIPSGGKAAVARSVARYIAALEAVPAER
ncbi:MAG: MBL fold metallo-hydrolase [Acetobacteraceae bacterium]|nr:MBL fold metallo-hydrolase [Acetobacteraceae bacterium]